MLGSKTRTLRAQEEARDLTWEAAPKLAVIAKFDPSVPHITLPPAVQALLDKLRHSAKGRNGKLPNLPNLPNLPGTGAGAPAPDQMLDFLLSP